MGSRWLALVVVLATSTAHADLPAEETLAALDRAIAERPHDVELLMQRGELLVREGRPQDALGDLRVALALAPGDVRGLVLEARALFDLRRDDAARAAIDRAVAIAPSSFEALRTRATMRAARGDRPGAIEDLDAALALADDVDAYVTRAALLRREHRSAEAARGLELALTAVDHAAPVVLACIDAWRESDEPARALPIVEDAISRAPLDPRLAILRGDVLTDLGRTEEATLAYGEALARIDASLARRSTVARLVDRGEALARLGRVAEAEGALHAARAREPEYAGVRALAERLDRARGAR